MSSIRWIVGREPLSSLMAAGQLCEQPMTSERVAA